MLVFRLATIAGSKATSEVIAKGGTASRWTYTATGTMRVVPAAAISTNRTPTSTDALAETSSVSRRDNTTTLKLKTLQIST